MTVSSPFRPSVCQDVPSSKTKRQDAHADEVGAVDALEGLRDHGPHAEQPVPLAAQSRDEPVPYSLPAKMTSGTPSAL